MKKNNIKKNKKEWTKKLKFRIKNSKWLDYSSNIAVRIAAIIEEKENFNQEALSGLLKVSPQQVSKILKGEQNLTLKTIANFSTALGTELISFPPYKDSFIRLLPSSNFGYNNKYKMEFLMGNLLETGNYETNQAIIRSDNVVIMNEKVAI